jgi:spore maturation protein CgeB
LKRKIRVGIKLLASGTFDPSKPGNVQGDEQVARAWEKYLARSERVQSVTLYDANSRAPDNLDVLIHYNPFLDLDNKTRNILYMQNAFPESKYPGGVTGIYRQVKDRFDGFLYTSRPLMEACGPGAVIPFATDPEVFFPRPDPAYSIPVALVGNDLRGGAINKRYFEPAIPLGLIVYGNQWTPPLSTVSRGKLPMDDLPKLYSSATINLNAHLADHIRWGTVNLRIYDILACGGFVISDYNRSMVELFGESVVCTEGFEDLWAKIVHYLSDTDERKRRVELGRKIVLSEHTYEARSRDLLKYLDEVL